MHSLTYASNGRWSQHHNMSLSVHMHVDDSYLLSTISHAQRWSQSCAIQLPIFHIVGYAVLCHDARCLHAGALCPVLADPWLHRPCAGQARYMLITIYVRV